MKVFQFFIVFVFITLAEHCKSAKLPNTNANARAVKKNLHSKVSHDKTSKVSTKSVKKSVIVQSPMAGLAQNQFAASPILDKLYEKRYHAMEKVAMLNSQINSVLQRNTQQNNYAAALQQNTMRNNYADAVSSFLNPGSFNSGSYRVRGGANAGSVAGAQNAMVRQLAVDISRDRAKNNAPLNIPLPLNDPEDDSQKPDDDKDDDVPADLGDPSKFDAACSVLKLTFEHTSGAMVLDDSPKINNAQLEDGAYTTSEGSKAGISASIGDDGYLEIPSTFKGKPKKAAAISMWVKLRNVAGINPLLQISDRNDSLHYDLSVVDGKAQWVHHNDTDNELFKVTANDGAHFTAGVWHHIVGTYSSRDKEASLWLDGKQVGSQKGVTGMLSQDWSHVYMFEGKTSGVADNIFMFRCPLDRTKIVALYVAVASPKDAKRFLIPKPN